MIINRGQTTITLVLTLGSPLIAASTPDFSACESVLTPYTATYDSRFRGIAMKGERRLELRNDGTLVLSHRARAFGSHADEQSVFTLEDGVIKVQQYDYLQSILGFQKEDHARFDWQNAVVNTRYKSARDLPLAPGIFDNLSQQLAIRCDAALGLNTMQYPVLKRAKIRTYTYERLGNETIETDLGPLDTIVLQRVQDADERTTRMWLAPDLNHILVRLHQTERKDNLAVTLDLSQVSFER